MCSPHCKQPAGTTAAAGPAVQPRPPPERHPRCLLGLLLLALLLPLLLPLQAGGALVRAALRVCRVTRCVMRLARSDGPEGAPRAATTAAEPADIVRTEARMGGSFMISCRSTCNEDY
jgi:hypothetical protein